LTALLALRFLKILSVAALFTGSIGAVLPRDHEDRRRFAHWIAGPAWLLTWASGVLLAWATGVSLLSTWILGAFVLTLISQNAVLWAVGKDGRRSVGAALVILVPLIVTVALMVWKP
jgi:hypothetical protein